MEFTQLEAIKLMLTFYTSPAGIWRDFNYEYSPEITKFVNASLVCVDKIDDRKLVPNEEGAALLRSHYMDVSSDFVKFMASKGFDCAAKETIAWAVSKYSLDDAELGKDLCDYIIGTLSNHGYRTYLPQRENDKYIIQKNL